MNTVKHLTQNQLLAYAAGSLKQSESHDIGKHLLQCAACRASLPAPTPQQFLSVLMSEKEIKENFSSEKSSFSLLPLFSHFSAFFRQPQTLIWSGGAMILILCLTYLIWLNAAQSSNMESEIAQSYEMENTEFIIKQNESGKINVPQPFPTVESTTKDSSIPFQKKSQQKQNLIINSRNNFNPKTKGKIPNENKESLSSTRGISPKWSDETAIEMQVGLVEETVVFRWKKNPNATKYHLYISDEEEILIDEYETDQETSFVLKKSLDPMKTYKWKIVITLKNGQTVVGSSQKFTVKDFQTNQKKSEKKRNSEIRCSVNG